MDLRLSLPPSPTIERDFLRALSRHVDRALLGAAPAVRRRIGHAARSLIEGTPEYASLLRGELLGELGIPNVESRLQRILEVIRDHVEVVRTPCRIVGEKLTGGLSVGILRSGIPDLLQLDAASYVSAPSGSTVSWLDWLTTQGDRIVVIGYDVDFHLNAAAKARSRTGMALMRKGSGWRVPPEFSGTPGANFLTRAFDGPGVEEAVARIFQEELARRL